MADITWIKLRIDMFDDEKIKLIQALPDGDTILVIWIRILALAGKCNANGYLCIEDEFPYSDEMLATIFNKSLPQVRLALETFSRFGMIEKTQRGIYVSNFMKHQNSDGMDRIREQNRLRKQRQRERQNQIKAQEQLLLSDMSRDVSRDSHEEITGSHATEIEEDKEKDINNNILNSREFNISQNPEKTDDQTLDQPEPQKRMSIDWKRVQADYSAICVDLPGIRGLTEGRKTKIRTLLKEFKALKIMDGMTPEEILNRLFRMVQDSDFLTGRNGKWAACTFDWIINKTNAIKIVEGNYKNKGGGNSDPDRNVRTESQTNSRTAENEALERFRRNKRL